MDLEGEESCRYYTLVQCQQYDQHSSLTIFKPLLIPLLNLLTMDKQKTLLTGLSTQMLHFQACVRGSLRYCIQYFHPHSALLPTSAEHLRF